MSGFFVFALLIGIAQSRSACSSSKLLPKYKEAFGRLENDAVVLEAKYNSIEEGTFRFSVIHTWRLNNGEIKYMDKVQVNTASQADTSITMCFDELTPKQNYLLLLRRGGESDSFVPLLAPFSLKKSSRRDEIRQAWCDLPENECPLKISRDHLPPVVELFPGTNTILRCQIDSKSSVNDIRWLKDGKDIETEGGDVYAKNGIYVHNTNLRSRTSQLVIYNAHRMHSGMYSCVAVNIEGENTDLQTRVVIGSEPSAFGACPSWAEDYCHSSAVCKSIVGLPTEVKCECKPGRSGRRCHDLSVPDLAETQQGDEEKVQKIHELTVATIILTATLVISVFLLLYVTSVMIRQRRKVQEAEEGKKKLSGFKKGEC